MPWKWTLCDISSVQNRSEGNFATGSAISCSSHQRLGVENTDVNGWRDKFSSRSTRSRMTRTGKHCYQPGKAGIWNYFCQSTSSTQPPEVINTHAHLCVLISVQSAEHTITSASNTTIFLPPLENWMLLKYLQFLHQELHFLRVAITLSREWNQQQTQIFHHHFNMHLSVRQPLCDSVQSVLPKSTAGLRTAGFDSRDLRSSPEEGVVGRSESSFWQMEHLQEGDAMGDNTPWKRLTLENDSKLVSRGVLNLVTSWKPKLPTLRSKVHKVNCRHEAAWGGVQWTQLKLLSSGILVWVYFDSQRVAVSALCPTEKRICDGMGCLR